MTFLNSVEATPFMQTARRSTPTKRLEMVQIPQYMVYANLPDGKLIGLVGGAENGNAIARYSSDDGSSWSSTTPLLALDASVGG